MIAIAAADWAPPFARCRLRDLRQPWTDAPP